MSAVSILELGLCRQRLAQQEWRRALRQTLDPWLDRLESLGEEKPSRRSLEEWSDFFREHRQELRGAIRQKGLESRYRPSLEQKTAHCRKWDRVLGVWEMSSRRGTTRVGSLTLTRPSFYCRHCQEGFHPLDEALPLAPVEQP